VEVIMPVPATFRRSTESVVLPARASSVSQARAHLAKALVARQVPLDLVADAQLVVSELMANAIRHARPLEGDTVRITWRVLPPEPPRTQPAEVELAVSDGGAPWHPRVESPPTDAAGGRGLGIVATVTEAWGVEGAGSGHQLVWAVLRCS
jgi:serine/threonine-protein kinase RsbW